MSEVNELLGVRIARKRRTSKILAYELLKKYCIQTSKL